MLNKISFLNFTSQLRIQKNNNQNSAFKKSSNISAPKLAPLKQDTINFSGKPQDEYIKKQELEESIYNSIANPSYEIVAKNARTASRELNRTLKTPLKTYICTPDSPRNPIAEISTRIKTPNSIREKLASNLAEGIKTGKIEISSLGDPETLKQTIGDIVGTRITLKRSEPKHTTKIINELIKLVEEGKLKITKIQDFPPKNRDNDSYRYFNLEDLERLRNAINIKRQQDGLEELPPIEPDNRRSTGYIALHLNVDLSNSKFDDEHNNYIGEIQILGIDVCKLKDVDDLCYKLRAGKAIKGGHEAYDKFVEYFTYHMQNPDYPNIKEDFEEYTARAYAIQRKKEPNEKGVKNFETLPTIAQCKMQKKIPPELDFNLLAALKKKCDKKYKEMSANGTI